MPTISIQRRVVLAAEHVVVGWLPTRSPAGRLTVSLLFLEQLHASDRWEIEPASISLDDLDQPEIVRRLNDAVNRGRVTDPLSRHLHDLLRGLGLVKDGRTSMRARPCSLAPTACCPNTLSA